MTPARRGHQREDEMTTDAKTIETDAIDERVEAEAQSASAYVTFPSITTT